MFGRSHLSNFAAELHQRIAIVAIAVDHSHPRIGTGKDRSQNDSDYRQLANANNIDRLQLRGQEKTKGWNNRKNSIHPFRRNQRHHYDSAGDPGNQKEHLRGKLGQPFSGRRFRLPQRHHEQSDNKQTPGREFLQQVRNIEKQRLRPMNPLMKTAGEFD